MQKTTQHTNFRIISLFHVIALLFCIINSISCGTQVKKLIPKLLVISFSGLRWDYLKNYNESIISNFNYLQSIGSHADYVTNNFFTDSLSNQWSIVTGLNEESHGMTQNEMFDTSTNRSFFIGRTNKSGDWFTSNSFEPIWISNQKASRDRHSFVEWVGGEFTWENETAQTPDANVLNDFSKHVENIIRIFTRDMDQVNFGLIYLDSLDKIGHKYGPYSKELTDELKTIDTKFVNELIVQLKSHKLFETMHLIFTSDHGMLNVSESNAIVLDKYVNTTLFDCFGGSTVLNVFLKNPGDFNSVYKNFSSIPNVVVYSKKEIPQALTYNKSSRAGDLVLIARYGYTIYKKKPDTFLKGAHGYDGNLFNEMNSFFIGVGPYFKKNLQIPPFRIVDIYPLMCEILEIEPRPNNGSLENVKSMLLIMSYDEKKAYIVVSLAPITLSILAASVLYLMNKRMGKSKKVNLDFEGYSMLPMKDEINLDTESDESETEVFSQN